MKPKTTTNNDESQAEAGQTFSEKEILGRAENVDRQVSADNLKNPLEAAMVSNPAGDQAQTLGPDPAIVGSLQVLVTLSVGYLKNSRGWDDPGPEWQGAVSQLGAKLIDKYMPGALNGCSDEVALVVMLAPWLIGNLMRPAPSTTDNDDSTLKDNVEPAKEVSTTDRPFRQRQPNEEPTFEVQGVQIGS